MQNLCQIKAIAINFSQHYNRLRVLHKGFSIMSNEKNSRKDDKNNSNDGLSPDYAIALGYDPDKHNAPVVMAKGQGFVAEKIIQIALDQGIEIRQDSDLVQILKAVDIDSEIPLEAFSAVAEIISYIYQVNNKTIPE